MKVILATESFPPNISGVATATRNLAENLVKAGHEPFVLTPGNTYKTKLDPKFPHYKVYRLKSIVNPFRRGYRITFTNEREIAKLVEEIKPDIIHLQDPAVIGQLLCNVGRNLGIPVLITNHFSLEYALSYLHFLHPLLPLFREGLIDYLANFYNKCDQVITPTETFRKQIVSWGVKSPVCAISNGIVIEPFLKHFSEHQEIILRQKLHLPSNPLILYLGRVDKDKSIDVLVRAIPEILKKVNAHFVIAGNGGEVENIKSLSEELGIREKVSFIGFIDHNSPDFAGLYKSASVFAIPSTIETQSIVTLEALASGLPVVAANAGALPELVKNNIDGFLFSPGNEKKLAANIIKILINKKMARKMSHNAIKMAMNHEMDKAFGEMLELYEKYISK